MDKDKILVFENKDFGSIRTVMIDGAPWFVATDVCAAIDVDRTAVRRLDDDEKGVHFWHTPGGNQKINIINEYGLYSLVMGSRKAEAKAFKRWITHEVIPSIRKHGAYMTTSLLEQVRENPQVIYGLAEKLLTERNRADWFQTAYSRAKPKADYYDAFVDPRDCTNIRNTANELGIPQCELTAWLVSQRFMYRDYGGHLIPYSPHLRSGLFIQRDFVRHGHKGVQALFTPHGKAVVCQMLIEAGYIPPLF